MTPRGLTRSQRDHLRQQIDTVKRARLAKAKAMSSAGQRNNALRLASYRAYYNRQKAKQAA